MNHIESIEEFYGKTPILTDTTSGSGIGHFNVFNRRFQSTTASYVRRDFYKIALVIGTGILRYADKEFMIEKPVLFFSNPRVPHSWQAISKRQDGWCCLFSEEFIQSFNRKIFVEDYPMFRLGGNPIVFMDGILLRNISYLFERMMEEKESSYIYKYIKLNNYLQLIIHEALGQYPASELNNKQINAVHRISYQFLELLGKQFPMESPNTPLKLRTVTDYARQLSVHANHLNRAVKEVTGKSPSTHILLRIAEEAKALILNTDWPISEIAYTLGFEYPSHFAAFLKKQTGLTPKQIRIAKDIV